MPGVAPNKAPSPRPKAGFAMAFRVKKRYVNVKWDGVLGQLNELSLDTELFAYKPEGVSHKSPRIAALIAAFEGNKLDAHYLGFFECFNRQLFFEAHEVLEELWLKERGQARDLFYKGLIQLAGAFVHVQKGRLGPAAALFRLAQKNLGHYLPVYEELELNPVVGLIDDWLGKVASAAGNAQGLNDFEFPILSLPAPARPPRERLQNPFF